MVLSIADLLDLADKNCLVCSAERAGESDIRARVRQFLGRTGVPFRLAIITLIFAVKPLVPANAALASLYKG